MKSIELTAFLKGVLENGYNYSMPDLPPEIVLNNRYRIVSKLGQGGMGSVYLAYDLSLEHQVAVKVNHNPSPQSTTQFLREARLLANLRHPNLPRVLDYFIISEEQFLVMDYIAGDDLATRLKMSGAQPLDLVLRWAEELGSALTYLHRQSPPVIHRDIKPANVKLTLEGEPILVDFGIAKAVEAGQETATGAVGYTPGYAPPEQYGGTARTGPNSDQYAFAATIYALIGGQKPEDGVQRVLGRAVLTPLRSLNPAVPEAVGQAVEKAMSIRPDDRFASIGEFIQALLSSNFEPTVPHAVLTTDPIIRAGMAASQAGRSAAANLPTVARADVGAPTPKAADPALAPVRAAEALPPQRKFPWLWVGIGAGGLVIVGVIVLAVVLALAASSANKLAAFVPTHSAMSSPLASIASATSRPLPQAATSTVLPSVTSTAIATSTTQAPTSTSTNTPVATASLTAAPQITTTSSQAMMGGGKLIAFSSDRADEKTFQIWTMQLSIDALSKVTPTNLVQVTTGEGDKLQPGWSPDGKQIIFTAPGDPKNGRDIWVMNVDGSTPRDLSNFPGDDSDPSWSPDGQWVAFTNQRSSDSLRQVYIMAVDGSQITRISTDQIEYQPFWSKDMKWLFNVIMVNGNNYLRMRDQASDYKGTPMPYDIFTVFGRLGHVANAVFSPDGSQIAYTRVDTPTNSVICVVNYATRGADIIQISTIKKDREPTWSPDSKWLVYTSIRDGSPQLYIMTTAGKLQTALTIPPGKSMQSSWQP